MERNGYLHKQIDYETNVKFSEVNKANCVYVETHSILLENNKSVKS